MDLFKNKRIIVNNNKSKGYKQKFFENPEIPTGLYVKCSDCNNTIYSKEINHFNICPECGYHFRISARERIKILADKNIFVEFDKDMTAKNPLDYPEYEQKLKDASEKTELNDAVVTGKCQIYGKDIILCVMDSKFIMGSMGCVVGEKITRAFEYATFNKLPIIIFTASGGARMQEGIFSLMQMAKVSSAVSRHSKAGLLYITILTDPTTGGVTASFAMLGDIILAEPKTLIGFAGPRVIEQTIKQKLPDGFQTSEFLLENGFIDKIVKREDMKKTLSRILRIHCQEESSEKIK
ncbi:MAG: acetyl-CoA carboxylase, carboxyltransferase subunit beta [bacterium]